MGLVHHPNVVTDGLRGCWDAGNRRSYPGAGTTWTDPVGGIKGTLINEDDDALSFNSFKGGYFEFDGTDGRVDCGDNLMVGWSEISVCVWALVENDGDDFPRLVTRGGSCFELAISRTTQHFLFCYVNGSYINTPTDSMNDHYGKWTHYAARWVTGTGDWRLYINGELIVASQKYDSTLGSDHNLSFADRPAGGRALDGAMGPVYIYDRALSNDEIKQNYEATKSRFEPRITKSGMFANWDAGDPASYNGGTTWKDTANHYDGTLENGGDGSLTFDSANGGSLDFDGTDDYMVSDLDKSQFTTTNEITISITCKQTTGSTGVGVLQFGLNLTEGTPWILFHRSGASIKWYVDGNYRMSQSYTVGQISNYTLTYSSNLWSCYKDGIFDTSYSGGIGSDGGEKFFIGTGYSGRCSMNTYNTLIYNRALSAAEVLDNYQKTKGRFGH